MGVVASRPLELKVFKRSVTQANLLTSNKRWRNEIATEKNEERRGDLRSAGGLENGEGGDERRREEKKGEGKINEKERP